MLLIKNSKLSMLDFNKTSDRTYYIVKYIMIIALMVLTYFIIKGYISEDLDKDEIIKYKEFTEGVITDYGHLGISDKGIEYEYTVEGITYKGEHRTNPLPCDISDDIENCLGKKCWVIYSKKNPKKSYMLTSEDSYRWFGLKVPKKIILD